MTADDQVDDAERESERSGGDEKRAEGRADHTPRPDPDAPGNYVDDEDAPDVPEPNEPA